jgi:hypothetical protein
MLQRLAVIAVIRILALAAFAAAGALILPDHRQGLALGLLAAVYARIGEGVAGPALRPARRRITAPFAPRPSARAI